MRYREILEEGAKAFLPMYQGLPILDQSDITNFIEKIEKQFVRKDRVTWFCRWHRIWYVNHSEAELEARAKREAREAGLPAPTEPVVSDKTWRKLLAAISPNITKEQAIEEADDVLSSVREFDHFMQLPVQGIKSIVWEKQSPDELLSMFRQAEDDWQASLKENRAVRIRPQDECIIDFGNGWAWWDLNRGGCRDEADAMGHCGNGSGGHGETILSLRKKLDDFHYSPHLTFILHDGETLGEMKGRNNEKPAEKYHGMIKALLLSDHVQDIKGGGYLPENNFSLSDLPEEEQEEIKEKKPTLRPAWEMWSEFEKTMEAGEKVTNEYLDALHRKVENEASKYGRYREIDWEKNEIIVSSKTLDSYTSFTNGIVSKLSSLMEGDDLSQIIEEYATNDEDRRNADSMADDVSRKFFVPMVETLLPYDINFRLHAMCARLTSDSHGTYVQHYIPVRDFLYEDDDTLNSLETFDEEYDDYDDFDRYDHVSFSDPIEIAIFDYVVAEMRRENGYGKNRAPGDKEAVATAILAEYGDPDARAKELNTSGRRVYTPTISHPDQLEFDFDDKGGR